MATAGGSNRIGRATEHGVKDRHAQHGAAGTVSPSPEGSNLLLSLLVRSSNSVRTRCPYGQI